MLFCRLMLWKGFWSWLMISAATPRENNSIILYCSWPLFYPVKEKQLVTFDSIFGHTYRRAKVKGDWVFLHFLSILLPFLIICILTFSMHLKLMENKGNSESSNLFFFHCHSYSNRLLFFLSVSINLGHPYITLTVKESLNEWSFTKWHKFPSKKKLFFLFDM